MVLESNYFLVCLQHRTKRGPFPIFVKPCHPCSELSGGFSSGSSWPLNSSLLLLSLSCLFFWPLWPRAFHMCSFLCPDPHGSFLTSCAIFSMRLFLGTLFKMYSLPPVLLHFYLWPIHCTLLFYVFIIHPVSRMQASREEGFLFLLFTALFSLSERIRTWGLNTEKSWFLSFCLLQIQGWGLRLSPRFQSRALQNKRYQTPSEQRDTLKTFLGAVCMKNLV